MAAGGLTPSAAAHWASAIDWASPWLAPYRAVGQPLAHAVQRGEQLCQALNAANAAQGDGAPVRFVPQACLSAGVAYESHIHATGECPTREGLHDFFNALVWLHHPHLKARLNAWQARAIAAAGGTSGPRGPLRDAITVFDENGALLHAPGPLWQALRARQWQRLFGELRPLWGRARLVLFGHALLQQLTRPRKPITAHVLALSGIDLIANYSISAGGITGIYSMDFTPEAMAAKPFCPLPVLGVPGWWAANEDAAFYADDTVFRPLPRRMPVH